MLSPSEELARFAARLTLDEVPERVRRKARHQILAVLGALYGSSRSEDARTVAACVTPRTAPGAVRLLPAQSVGTTEDALLSACSATMALDFDDYVFAGHTGHSAVLVPLLVGAEMDASGSEALVAQIVANEIGARLGAAMLIGPLNGQMWAPIHAAAAACAAGRLLGLDEGGIADALGIALGAPPMPLMPSFMGSGAKVLTAALPARTGLLAARLAARGMRGARDVIEGPGGLLARFSYAPAPFFLGGLGRAWLTDTIAFKVYPGCAYIGSAVDALLEILARSPIDARDVDRVDVHASLVTVGMQHLSEAHAPEGRLSPVNINFSIPFNVALVLRHGRLDPRVLETESLAREEAVLRALAARVRVHHDWTMTMSLATAVERSLHLRHALRALDPRGLWRARRELVGEVARPTARDVRDAIRTLAGPTWSALRGRRGRPRTEPREHAEYDLGRADLEGFTFPFGARVEVRTKDGRTFAHEVDRPRGTPGDWDATFRWTEEKLRREAGFAGVGSRAGAIVDCVRCFETSSARQLHDLL